MHRYTKEQIDYIRSIKDGRFIKDIHKMFVEKFNVDVSVRSIQSIMHRNGIKNRMQGYDTRLQKGHKAWNKGMKGINLGGEKGWFPKGNKPPSYVPVGSESMHEGEVLIKVDDPNVWEKKHRWLWKKHYGEIPDGKVIAFKDGNKLNVTLDNLFMTKRMACAYVARRKMPNHHPSLNLSSHRLAELDIVIKHKEKA